MQKTVLGFVLFGLDDDCARLSVFLDEAERKYLFECDSQEQCVEWIDAIIKSR